MGRGDSGLGPGQPFPSATHIPSEGMRGQCRSNQDLSDLQCAQDYVEITQGEKGGATNL